MQFLFLSLTFLSLTAGAAEKVCSNENMLSVLKQSGQLVGQLGRYKVSVERIVAASKDQPSETLKSNLTALGTATSQVMEPPRVELDKLIKANPECNIGGAFGFVN